MDNDNLLDILLSNGKEIYGYNSIGDKLLQYSNDSNKSNPVIADIDSDNDIEIIFSESGVDFGSTEKDYVVVSDIDIYPNSNNSIYPRMNELCNNLYSQPVSGQLAANTDYHWSGSITLHDEVTLPVTSTLTIKPGTIIKAKENSKLICYGNIFVNGTENYPVKIIPAIIGASENYWQGIELPEGLTIAEMNHVTIQNAEINTYRNLTIDNSELINTPINMDRYSLYLDNSILNNSPINAELYGIQSQSEIISINNCNIANLSQDAGIDVTGYPNISISYNVIENCNSGIKLWESGSGLVNTISNNTIIDNAQYGIFAFHSNIEILEHNVIYNNEDGIFITHDSNFTLIGTTDYPLQIIRDNDEHEVRFSYESRPSQLYHNKIYDDNHEYSYVKCEHVPLISMPISVSNNNWGASFNPETDLSPLEVFTYLPIWYPGDPGDPEKGIEEEMYLSAKQNEDIGNYTQAEQIYEQIISLYPESKFAKISAKELLDLKVKYDQDFVDLKLYYETEPNMQYDDEMIRLSEFLITCCNVKLEEFQPAITWFEDIIQDPPSIVDSVFAVIDAGYTYLLMENSRSSFSGKISDLKPQSRKQYTIKRDELIDMLFGDTEPENEIPLVYKLALFPNYPNPFNPETTISFSIPEDSKVGLTIYNIKGQKVRTLVNGELEKGLHDVVWNSKDSSSKSVASGVYFYKFDVNGKTKGLKKMLLLK